MGDVHKLTGHMLPGEVNTDLVEALEDLTERAKTGEVVALAWAGYRPDDSCFNGWDGPGGTMFALGASVGLLQTRYQMMMLEGEDE
jgi:hypothetical protein